MCVISAGATDLMSNLKRKVAVAAIGVVALVLPVTDRAQTTPVPAPKFDVVSIRPCDNQNSGNRSSSGSWSPGRLVVNCKTVKDLIERAYLLYADGRMHVWPPQLLIEGGPAWIDSTSYTIEANSEGAEGRSTLNGPMLQALLEDRFRLRLHRETREVPVYALTVAKGGPKLQPYREGSCARLDLEHMPPPEELGKHGPLCGISSGNAKVGYQLYRTTIVDFATEFSSRLDRPVLDKTGLAGMFNIDLDLFATDLHNNARPTDPSVPATPNDTFSVVDTVRVALRKVGLNLGSTRGP